MDFSDAPEDTFSLIAFKTNTGKLSFVAQAMNLLDGSFRERLALGGQATVRAQLLSEALPNNEVYVNDVALLACERLHLAVPPVTKVISRADLPRTLALDVDFPYFNGRPTRDE